MKKKQKSAGWAFSLVWLLQLLAEAAAVYYIRRLDMLPEAYLLAVVALLALAAALTGVLLLQKGKDKSRTARRAIGMILAVLMTVGSVSASTVADRVYNTMQGITTPTVEGTIFSVLVRKEDPAQSVEELSGEVFGYTDLLDGDRLDKAFDQLGEKLGKTPEKKEFESLFALAGALLSGEVRAVVMDTAFLSFLEEDKDLARFESLTRELHQIVVVEDTPDPDLPPDPQMPQLPAEPEKKPVDVDTTPFVIYVSGSDTRSTNLNVKGRSDVNILVVVNPKTSQVLMINTPRDYYVQNPGLGNKFDKLTHCGNYGISCSQTALSQLYGVDINYYAKINFAGFETLIDAIDGVTVYSDVAFNAMGTPIRKGENHLYGRDALRFARERYALSGGDDARGKNQMKVIQAVIDKLSTGVIISRYAQILHSLEGMFVTNMVGGEIPDLVKLQLSEMPQWDVQNFAVRGKYSTQTTASIPGLPLSVTMIDERYTNHAADLIQRVLAGEKLTAEDMKLPG